MLIDRLHWDSRHFGLRIGRIHGNRLSLAGHAGLAEEIEQFDCVYFLADPGDAESAEAAARHGFHFVDGRLTLAAAIPAGAGKAGPPRARPARTEDLPRLEAIASTAHADSRFYFDGRFPRDKVEEMFRIWIRRSVAEPDHAVLVTDEDGAESGYVACSVDAERLGHIELIAVQESARGRGLGRALLESALGWLAGCGADRVVVTTQVRNLSAQRLYQRAGFLPDSLGVWYHWWAPASSQSPGARSVR